MENNAQHFEPVNASHFKSIAPPWLRLEVVDPLHKLWRALIVSYLRFANVILGDKGLESGVLYIAQLKQRLSFCIHLPNEFIVKHSEAVRGLHEMAEHLSVYSGLLLEDQTCNPNEAPVLGASILAAPLQLELFDVGDSASCEVPDTGSEPGLALAEDKSASVPVFTWSDWLKKDGGRSVGRDTDSSQRIRQTLVRLEESGTERELRRPQSGWQSLLGQLSSDFPNFSPLIQAVISPHLTLVSRGIVHRMNSVIVVGPPGIGKTYFAQQLATILDTGPPLFVSMATETNNSTLVGSSTFWSNSSPGTLFERLAWGTGEHKAVANPLLILDEVDKVSVERFDPLGPLYSLLEAETARSFQDQSLPDVIMDASHVRVIATANDLTVIPAPLLSRALVFHIDAPGREQLLRVVQRIYLGILNRMKVDMRQELSPAVAELAVSMSPREVKVRLECAVASAISHNRDHILATDWLTGSIGGKRQKTIGFTA